MGNCCTYFPHKPKFLQYFYWHQSTDFTASDVDTLMDLDYLEEPQLTFRINETPFTVSSYLNWVSNKPRPLDEETANSANSSISSRRGTSKRSSLSRLAGIGGHSSLGPVDIASQKLLFNAADPKSKPPPQAYDTSPTDGSWAALASVAEQGHKTSTSAVFMPDKAAARHVMSRSCHAEVDEMDGPEIARLMRRFWPRDLNFFGASQNSSGRRSLCESRSSVASSTASKSSQRPTILNLRNVCEVCLPNTNGLPSNRAMEVGDDRFEVIIE
uniref:AGC-kinase C-terminal domain-containing protein n=1 Tax=Mesocestoides corti TaxID=53468 RepID=A0A5K3F9N1_MESCO